MLSFKPCYTISVSLVKRRSEMNAVSFFETLGSTHIKSQNKKPHQDIFTLLREHCHDIISPKVRFNLRFHHEYWKAPVLGHTHQHWVLLFYLCFSNDLEDWNPGRNVIFLTRRLGRGEEMFPPSGDRKGKPKQQHLLYKDQRLTAKEYGRLTWSGRGSRTARHRPARKHKSRVTASPVPGHSLQSLFPWANLVFISS